MQAALAPPPAGPVLPCRGPWSRGGPRWRGGPAGASAEGTLAPAQRPAAAAAAAGALAPDRRAPAARAPLWPPGRRWEADDSCDGDAADAEDLQDLQALRDVFQACDANGDGSINLRELIKACRQRPEVATVFGLPSEIHQEGASRRAVMEFFQGADSDDNREVTWEELCRFCRERRPGTGRPQRPGAGGGAERSPARAQPSPLLQEHAAAPSVRIRRAELAGAARELQGAARALRGQQAAALAVVDAARAQLGEGAAELALQAARASAELRLCAPTGPSEAAQRSIRELEERIARLRLEDGDRQQCEEADCARTERELDALAAQAEDAERGEAAAAAALAERLPALRRQAQAVEAQAAEARQRRQQQDELLEARAFVEETSDEERHCFEWCQMLREDRPERSALDTAEEQGAAWERRLRELLLPAAAFGAELASPGRPAGGARLQGIERLDAEIGRLATEGKARHSTAAECLQQLSASGQQCSAAFGEVLNVHSLVGRLRETNGALDGEISRLRHERWSQPPPADFVAGAGTDADSAASAPAASGQAQRPPPTPAARGVVTQPNLPRGPQFRSPVQAALEKKQRRLARALEEGDCAGSRVPKAVFSGKAEWDAGAQARPRAPQEQGLAFLCKASGQRFRPSATVPVPSFEFGPSELDLAAAEAEGTPKPQAAADAGERARLAAEAFREPLSLALRGPSGPPRSAPWLPAGAPERPRARSEWVTFESCPTSPAGPCKAPRPMWTG